MGSSPATNVSRLQKQSFTKRLSRVADSQIDRSATNINLSKETSNVETRDQLLAKQSEDINTQKSNIKMGLKALLKELEKDTSMLNDPKVANDMEKFISRNIANICSLI